MKKLMIVLAALMLVVTVGCKKDDVEPNQGETTVIVVEDSGDEPTIDSTELNSLIVGEWRVHSQLNSSTQEWENLEADSVFVDITDTTITGFPGTTGVRNYGIPEPSVLLIEWTDSINKHVWAKFEGELMDLNGESNIDDSGFHIKLIER